MLYASDSYTQPQYVWHNVPWPWVQDYGQRFRDIFCDQRSMKQPISRSNFDPLQAEIGPVNVPCYPVESYACHSAKASIKHLTKCT